MRRQYLRRGLIFSISVFLDPFQLKLFKKYYCSCREMSESETAWGRFLCRLMRLCQLHDHNYPTLCLFATNTEMVADASKWQGRLQQQTSQKPSSEIFRNPVPRQPAQKLKRVNHRVLSCHRCLWMLVSFEILGGHPPVWRPPTKQLSISEYSIESIDLFDNKLAPPYAGDSKRPGGGVHSVPLRRWVLPYRPWDVEHDLADKAILL